ncbi:MAG: biotin/lipoate A/B protein ligase family protein [Chitinispirillia bacterium]
MRIIRDGYHSAAFNMAADLYLLENCINDSYVYIRFYHWIVPTITLGYNQITDQTLDLKKVKWPEISWIRRPTGGRAVLHHDDITYSCAFSRKMKVMGGTVEETYRIISNCLKKGLEKSGIMCQCNDSSLNNEKFSSNPKLPCFLAPNRNEIMVDKRKLVGSAQRRTSDSVLQHGSIPVTELFRNLPLYQKISPEEERQQIRLLQKKCTCIKENTEYHSIENIVSNLINGFEYGLSLPVEIGKWTLSEIEKIDKIAEKKRFIEKWQQ